MNSGSEKKLSMDELMALNRTEPSPQPTAQESSSDHAHCHPVSVAGGSDDADTEDRIHRVGSAWNAGVKVDEIQSEK